MVTAQREGRLLLRKTEGIREWQQAVSGLLGGGSGDQRNGGGMATTREFWSRRQFSDCQGAQEWLLARQRTGNPSSQASSRQLSVTLRPFSARSYFLLLSYSFPLHLPPFLLGPYLPLLSMSFSFHLSSLLTCGFSSLPFLRCLFSACCLSNPHSWLAIQIPHYQRLDFCPWPAEHQSANIFSLLCPPPPLLHH